MKRGKIDGRPKKSVAEKLKYKVTVKLRPQDYYNFKASAKTAGMRPAELARAAMLGLDINPRLTPEETGWMRQLSGMANNLNQLTRQAYISGYPSVAEENKRLAGEISAIIKQVRNDS